MRRGKLNNEYIINNGWYYFRDPSKKRAFKESIYGPIYTPKKKYNRGNHDKANYPNRSFWERNEMRKLAGEKNKAVKIPRAAQTNDEIQQNIANSIKIKNYGGFISNRQLNRVKFNPTNKGRSINKKGPYEV